ncbi:5-deoxy-glucuronate isomerase [Paucibacter oligotrophus]|uniref:5-deoxy-glucuronate isomerase n=1 Tax=Roseateles oligotrophus TaxID=1769250 RepID=A0A840L6I9_9BURK|nr:5-deoxy-glucuronate isomerase [Roseateles oligotrophus]MBB4843646.1 5-deoxy-glucuronate isomerase [Roseateles oligotrophus]
MSEHFHTIPSTPGHHPLQGLSCQLLGFEKLVLLPGHVHEGRCVAERETLLVVLSGTATVQVGEQRFERVGGRANVFAGKPHSVYLPRGARYQLEAGTRFEAALVSTPSNLDVPAYEIRPDAVRTGSWGALNYTRHFREILTLPDGQPAASLIVGETLTPSGNWSTYPPHKHEREEGGEVFHEEIYYFRVASPEGFGLARHFSPERGFDTTHTVRDDSLLSIPYGYHTYAAAPGAQSYYLWALAGNGRRQGVALLPELAWTQKLVGMA